MRELHEKYYMPNAYPPEAEKTVTLGDQKFHRGFDRIDMIKRINGYGKRQTKIDKNTAEVHPKILLILSKFSFCKTLIFEIDLESKGLLSKMRA